MYLSRVPSSTKIVAELSYFVPLIIPAEIHARLAGEREAGDAAHLGAVVHFAIVFPPRGLLGVTQQIRAGDVVRVAFGLEGIELDAI